MRRAIMETMVGLFMLIGIAALLLLAFKVSGLSRFALQNGYTITAVFENVGDLKVRAPVTMAGVRVGEVTGVALDPKSFNAMVTIKINSQFDNIPVEGTTASILTAGLLGSNYISLSPGYGDSFLKEGDQITDTQPALILEQMIGQLLFKTKGEEPKIKSTGDGT